MRFFGVIDRHTVREIFTPTILGFVTYTFLVVMRGIYTLIEQVLDFAKIESGKFSEPKIAPFELRRTLEQVQLLFARAAQKKDLELTVATSEDAPPFLTSDEGRIRQILCNLVGNAVKFTEQGQVRVTTSHLEGKLAIEVSDTGPGISEEHIASVFEPFSQVDDSSTRKHGGTGLGLAISKDLAESLNGSLTLASRPGEGAVFKLTVPAQACPHPESKQTSSQETFHRDYRALVVDDDPTNRRVASRQLGQLGIESTVAQSDAEALSLCEQENFDLIFMDLQMPEQDGLEATREIHKLKHSSEHVPPIIALTTHAGTEERDRCFEAGMLGFLNKPLQRAKLTAEIERLEGDGLLIHKDSENLSRGG